MVVYKIMANNFKNGSTCMETKAIIPFGTKFVYIKSSDELNIRAKRAYSLNSQTHDWLKIHGVIDPKPAIAKAPAQTVPASALAAACPVGGCRAHPRSLTPT